jgi:hypothetical protein
MNEERPAPAIRLEAARRARGFEDAKSACRYFGWVYDSYIQHERGERGLSRSASRYATAFRVSVGWLLNGEGEGPTLGATYLSTDIVDRNLSTDGDEPIGFHDGWKPKIADGIAQLDARAGAGDGAVGQVVTIKSGGIASGHLVTDEWVVPRRALGVAPSHVFAIPVDGTSMEPGLKSEDVVFVDRATATIKSDEVHLIDDGSGPMVKRIRLEREHEPPRLWIMSDNPSVENYWRPADTIRIIGRVIGKFVRM